MFFVIDRPKLQRIISLVREDMTPSKQGDNSPFLRMEAKGNELTVSGSKVSGSFPATVYEPGVLFLRTTVFRKMLRTFTEEKFLSLQAAQDGLHFGNVYMPFEFADMVLFPIPEQAPDHWPPPFPERELIPEAKPEPKPLPEPNYMHLPLFRWAEYQKRISRNQP